jgi:hypothetical protein
MTSPSTKPAVKVLLSQIALIVDALNDRKRMVLGVIVSITEPVPSPGGEDTYVDAATIPRSHPMKSIAIVWMMWAINVWSVKKKLSRDRRFYKYLLPPRL